MKRKHSLQGASTVDQHVTDIGEFLTSLLVANADMPQAFLLIPPGAHDSMPQLDVFCETVSFNHTFEVLPDLG